MKKFLLAVFLISNVISSQEIINDTLQTTRQDLDEVIVKGIRAKFSSPISFTNVDKQDLKSKNLGQDLPILLNFLPSVVTTSDAGAGIGYTGIRIRGVSPQSTNITINGIPFNDPEGLICQILAPQLKACKFNEVLEHLQMAPVLLEQVLIF